MKLTQEQQDILNNCNSNIAINSCPGSGKSTILSYICDKILQTNNTFVQLITFTNVGAKTILQKCENKNQSRIIGGTFHSLAYKYLKSNNYNYDICDEHKKRLIIKKLFDCKKDREKFDEIYNNISKLKSQYPVKFDDQLNLYNNELKKYNLLDFDDIILEFIDKIKLSTFRIPNITHCLVDELQDTDLSQLEMLKAINVKSSCKMIGSLDGDQVIFAWRGARPENIDDFIKLFNCKVMNMSINFRSTTKIVNKATQLINNNINRLPKNPVANSEELGWVSIAQFKNHYDEIDYVVKKCRINYEEEIAIIYRNRLYKNLLEFELRKANLKYTINDSTDISDRSAVKTIIGLLKVASSSFDIYDLQQAAKGLKGIGITSIKKIDELAKTKSLNLVIQEYHGKKGWLCLKYIDKIQKKFQNNINKKISNFIGLIDEYLIKSFDFPTNIKSFLLEITKDYELNVAGVKKLSDDFGLDNSVEHQDDTAKITLTTSHGSKSKEYEMVIVPWCQQFDPQPRKEYDLEAERRLFYVTITRAKSTLCLIYSGIKPKFIEELE